MKADGLVILLHENIAKLRKAIAALEGAIEDGNECIISMELPRIRKALNATNTTFSVLELSCSIDNSTITKARAIFEPPRDKAQLLIEQTELLLRRKRLVARAVERWNR